MEAFIPLYIYRIHYIELIKTNTGVRNRAIERILQKAETIFINIYILKNILQNRSQHITCTKQFIDSG